MPASDTVIVNTHPWFSGTCIYLYIYLLTLGLFPFQNIDDPIESRARSNYYGFRFVLIWFAWYIVNWTEMASRLSHRRHRQHGACVKMWFVCSYSSSVVTFDSFQSFFTLICTINTPKASGSIPFSIANFPLFSELFLLNIVWRVCSWFCNFLYMAD